LLVLRCDKKVVGVFVRFRAPIQMSKTIIKMVLTISPNNNTIPMKLLKLVNFKFIPDRTQNWFHISVINV
jgi:hypothetical protein